MSKKIIADTNFEGLKVGSELIKLAECEEYLRVNAVAIRKKLEKALGYKSKWEQSFVARGGKLKEYTIRENLRPQPYEVTRIVTELEGYQKIYLSRKVEGLMGEEGQHSMILTVGDLDRTFMMLTFDEFLNERLEKTVLQVKKYIATQNADDNALEMEELEKAKAVIKNHSAKPFDLQKAIEADPIQARMLKGAAKLVNAAKMPQRKGHDSDLADVIDSYSLDHPASAILNAR